MGSEVDLLNSGGASTQKRLTAFARFGQQLQGPSDLLTAKTIEFENLLNDLDAAVKGLLRSIEANPEALYTEDSREFLDQIVELAQSSRDGMTGLSDFGASVGSLGSISKALRRPGKQMQELIRRMAKAAALIDDWEADAVNLRKKFGAAEEES